MKPKSFLKPFKQKKKCSNCRKTKSVNKFNKHSRKGIQDFCISCQRNFNYRYYLANKRKMIRSINKAEIRRRELNHLKVARYKLDNPCVECLKEKVVNYEIADLTFDHKNRKKKSFDISYLVIKGYSHKLLEKEISKCEVVCWFHHIKRESKRRNDFVFTLSKKLATHKTLKAKKKYLEKEILKRHTKIWKNEKVELLEGVSK